MTIEFTRADYIDERCSYRQYYDQFVDADLIHELDNAMGSEVMKSTDPTFSDIPMRKWESVAGVISNRTGFRVHLPVRVIAKLLQAGDVVSVVGAVAIYKAAARRLRGF